MFICSVRIPLQTDFRESKMDWIPAIVMASWHVLVASAPYMLLGFFVAGLLKAFLPDTLVARHLGGRSFMGLFKASALGVPMPLCSCGVLPAAAGLRQQGAGKGPTTAFLISTPETGVDSIAVTWALLDPFMALIRPLSAFITAMVTGGMVQMLDREGKAGTKEALTSAGKQGAGQPDLKLSPLHMAAEGMEPSVSCKGACNCGVRSEKLSFFQRVRSGMAFAFGDLFKDIALWFMVGVLIAGGISVFVTPEMVSLWLGHPVLAMLAMLVISVPLYVCATASTPIAAALVLKGLNPGAALVFLLAGPATNAASLTVIARILGRRMTAVYVAGIMICALGMGMVADGFYGMTGGFEGWHTEVSEDSSGYFAVTCALVLLGLFAWKLVEELWLRFQHRESTCGCGHCH